ncbi:hypothetical protein M501DRAFT_1027889 [Patellaria atrata CBS 101060]|uniref:DUF7918 domain-containing protein n=1 Tax=Patellaria atrata CBS 101060 TaxID=1346257 RepID=A0A9P4SJN3_9PEZI|nr:hypothetical protein M501DRAFT_1027889 [Patellaria atrata CBS 101060]
MKCGQPYIEVQIIQPGTDLLLPEYSRTERRGPSSQQLSCYLEAIPAVKFRIRVIIDPLRIWGASDTLSLRLRIDNQVATDDRFMYQRKILAGQAASRVTWERVTILVGGEWKDVELEWGMVGGATVPSSSTSTAALPIGMHTGRITVDVYQGYFLTGSATPNDMVLPALITPGAPCGQLLRVRPVMSTMRSTTKPDPGQDFRMRGDKYQFTFHYGSAATLAALGVVVQRPLPGDLGQTLQTATELFGSGEVEEREKEEEGDEEDEEDDYDEEGEEMEVVDSIWD